MYVLSDGVLYKANYHGTNDVSKAKHFRTIGEVLDFVTAKKLETNGCFKVFKIKKVTKYEMEEV